MQRKDLPTWLLTLALVSVFGYFGVDKLIHPEFWLSWIPPWMEGLLGMTREQWLPVIGISEAALAVLVAIPINIIRKTGALLIALHLVAILTQVGFNDIGVRDFGLLLSSLALFFLL